MDTTLWVAILTGGTAVLAGWVTSLGNTRAAKVQAEASTRVQRGAARDCKEKLDDFIKAARAGLDDL